MIIKKSWKSGWTGYRYKYVNTGWFLFGLIPLYIVREVL